MFSARRCKMNCRISSRSKSNACWTSDCPTKDITFSEKMENIRSAVLMGRTSPRFTACSNRLSTFCNVFRTALDNTGR